MEKEKSNLTLFLDNIGRTIIGIVNSSDEEYIHVTNPVIFNPVPTQDGRVNVQLFPLFFKDFLGDKDEDTVFSFRISSITKSSITALDYRLESQYSQLFGKNNTFVPQSAVNAVQQSTAPQQQNNSKVVNLFDE